MDGGDGCAMVQMDLIPLNFILKWLQWQMLYNMSMASVILRALYQDNNNIKRC